MIDNVQRRAHAHRGQDEVRIDRSGPNRSRSRSNVVKLGQTILISVVMAFLSVGLVGQSAWAHGGDGEVEGYLIVQQAISYLVNEPSSAGISEALMKVDEALAAEDQDGVAVPKLEQAREALTRGDSKAGRDLLQASIQEAVAALPPAVGEETGTGVVLAPYVARGALGGVDWLLLALSVLVAIGGAVLAVLFRPREGLRELSRGMLTAESNLELNGGNPSDI